MYVYDQYDQHIIEDRVRQFRDQTRRFLAGELADEEFRPLRLQNGLYIQRYAPMLRIAVPYGLLSSTQVRKLAEIARRYDKGYAHIVPVPTCSSTGLSWKTYPRFSPNWPRCRCTLSRPAATASATPPPISSPAWLVMS